MFRRLHNYCVVQTCFATFGVTIKVNVRAFSSNIMNCSSDEDIATIVHDGETSSTCETWALASLRYSQCSNFEQEEIIMANFFEDGITEPFHESVSTFCDIFISILFNITICTVVRVFKCCKSVIKSTVVIVNFVQNHIFHVQFSHGSIAFSSQKLTKYNSIT